MTENQRLKLIQQALGFSSQVKFAEVLGIKQGSLSDIYRAKEGIGVSDSIKRLLERDYHVNISWLETGEGEMLQRKQEGYQRTAAPLQKASDRNSPYVVTSIVDAEKHSSDHRIEELLEMLRKRDEQINVAQQQISKAQSQIDRLIALLEKR